MIVKNSSFKDSLVVIDNSKLQKLRRQYELHKISESDLSDEQKEELTKLYDDENIKLKQEIASIESELKKMLQQYAEHVKSKKNQSN